MWPSPSLYRWRQWGTKGQWLAQSSIVSAGVAELGSGTSFPTSQCGAPDAYSPSIFCVSLIGFQVLGALLALTLAPSFGERGFQTHAQGMVGGAMH